MILQKKKYTAEDFCTNLVYVLQDFDTLDMSNECDSLGDFLKLTDDEKKTVKIGITGILPEERQKAKEEQKQKEKEAQSPAPTSLTNGVSNNTEVGVC